MATYEYKARKTTPVTIGSVDAPSREEAIAQIVATAAPGEEIEVMNVVETAPGAPGGVTGPTGTMALSDAHTVTRSELNEMTKDDLLTQAASEGVEVSPHWTKTDIIDTIVKHRHK